MPIEDVSEETFRRRYVGDVVRVRLPQRYRVSDPRPALHWTPPEIQRGIDQAVREFTADVDRRALLAYQREWNAYESRRLESLRWRV